MIEFIILVTSKVVVVSLAILGAIFTTFAKVIAGAVVAGLSGSQIQNTLTIQNKIAKFLVLLGYAAMSVSIFLFIVSGFIVDLF